MTIALRYPRLFVDDDGISHWEDCTLELPTGHGTRRHTVNGFSCCPVPSLCPSATGLSEPCQVGTSCCSMMRGAWVTRPGSTATSRPCVWAFESRTVEQSPKACARALGP